MAPSSNGQRSIQLFKKLLKPEKKIIEGIATTYVTQSFTLLANIFSPNTMPYTVFLRDFANLGLRHSAPVRFCPYIMVINHMVQAHYT